LGRKKGVMSMAHHQGDKVTDKEAKYKGGENGKDGPDAEGIGNGGDPRIRVIIPKITEVEIPEIGRSGEDGGDGHDGDLV